MKTTANIKHFTRQHRPALLLALAAVSTCLQAGEVPKDKSAAGAAKEESATGGLVPLNLTLPAPAFKGTPKDIELSSYVEPLSDKPRPPLMVPAGLNNLAKGLKATCSDKTVPGDELAKITDGDKEPSDASIVTIRKGTQWVQLDLGGPREIFAIVIWHAHNAPKVFHDVIVQASDDPEFKTGVQTLFNNDQDNSSNLGAGTDREYFENNEGRLIAAKGVKARFLRCYSKGSTESALNEYTEIEVYGRAVP
jgi:hypothetical protein